MENSSEEMYHGGDLGKEPNHSSTPSTTGNLPLEP
jgi:hypothetical protein